MVVVVVVVVAVTFAMGVMSMCLRQCTSLVTVSPLATCSDVRGLSLGVDCTTLAADADGAVMATPTTGAQHSEFCKSLVVSHLPASGAAAVWCSDLIKVRSDLRKVVSLLTSPLASGLTATLPLSLEPGRAGFASLDLKVGLVPSLLLLTSAGTRPLLGTALGNSIGLMEGPGSLLGAIFDSLGL